MFLAAQVISIIALLLNMFSMQLRRRSVLLICNSIVCGLIALQFFMIGAHTAAIIFCVAIFRALFFYFFDSKQRPLWPLLVVLAMFLVAGLATWNGTAIGIIPIVSPLIGSWGLWQLHTQKIRKVLLIPPSLWFLHNIVIGAYGAAIFELVNVIATATGIVRNRKMALEQKELLS